MPRMAHEKHEKIAYKAHVDSWPWPTSHWRCSAVWHLQAVSAAVAQADSLLSFGLYIDFCYLLLISYSLNLEARHLDQEDQHPALRCGSSSPPTARFGVDRNLSGRCDEVHLLGPLVTKLQHCRGAVAAHDLSVRSSLGTHLTPSLDENEEIY